MTQSIFVQVGQCGNQIGYRFWDLALREYASVAKTNTNVQNNSFADTMQSFFVPNTETSKPTARAVLVDMEEGVVNELLRSRIGSIFNSACLITDVSGSGNNWAVGHYTYGSKHRGKILETLRKSAELCSSLQCFFVLHSMGGGTGSGVGSYITRLLADEFPSVYKIVTAVFPSLDDDVITSPYNTMLSLNQLTDFADCVITVENRALGDIVRRAQTEAKSISTSNRRTAKRLVSSCDSMLTTVSKAKPFDEMNNIVANLLVNLTSSARFPGTMNVDLNELSMNLVPFPRLHYLIAAQSPVAATTATSAPRNIDQMFMDAFSRDFQLISASPMRHTFLATSLLLRGSVCASDIRRNIERLQSRLQFVPWNREGWKVGHCQTPAVGQPVSLLALSNSTAIRGHLSEILCRFTKLMKKKAHLHHYVNVDGFEMENFDQGSLKIRDLLDDYAFFDEQASKVSFPVLPRLRIAD